MIETVGEIAGRCEAATGPDRELDAAIAPLQGLRIVDEGRPIGRVCYDANGHGVPLPSYTSSLDAAMTLVPEAEWPWNVTMATHYGSASVMPCDGKSTGIHDKRGGHCRGAATPALALCAAALRAHLGAHP